MKKTGRLCFWDLWIFFRRTVFWPYIPDKILCHRLAPLRSTYSTHLPSTLSLHHPSCHILTIRDQHLYIYMYMCVCIYIHIYILTSINCMYSAPISCHNLLFYFIYFIRLTCCMCAYLSLVTAGRLLSMSSSSSKAFSLKSSILARIGQCSCYTQRYSVVSQV